VGCISPKVGKLGLGEGGILQVKSEDGSRIVLLASSGLFENDLSTIFRCLTDCQYCTLSLALKSIHGEGLAAGARPNDATHKPVLE